MNKFELKPKFFIEGFDSVIGDYNEKLDQYSYYDVDKSVLYYGKTENISEIEAIHYADHDFINQQNNKLTSKEYILSKCKYKFCIIYVMKNL